MPILQVKSKKGLVNSMEDGRTKSGGTLTGMNWNDKKLAFQKKQWILGTLFTALAKSRNRGQRDIYKKLHLFHNPKGIPSKGNNVSHLLNKGMDQGMVS